MVESENLEKLAADENEDVRSAAVGNPNMPASLLERLAALIRRSVYLKSKPV